METHKRTHTPRFEVDGPSATASVCFLGRLSTSCPLLLFSSFLRSSACLKMGCVFNVRLRVTGCSIFLSLVSFSLCSCIVYQIQSVFLFRVSYTGPNRFRFSRGGAVVPRARSSNMCVCDRKRCLWSWERQKRGRYSWRQGECCASPLFLVVVAMRMVSSQTHTHHSPATSPRPIRACLHHSFYGRQPTLLCV